MISRPGATCAPVLMIIITGSEWHGWIAAAAQLWCWLVYACIFTVIIRVEFTGASPCPSIAGDDGSPTAAGSDDSPRGP